ncbi:hypothetical protein [Burkholderia cenocepacia]|uniref:Uncharacterized protein n=1 Tax=Burkholderia cenocepacia TaxID=95486 RepID=A0A3Q9FBF7_9BURK|nr:hypothetical protein [Burkholderia cenocepacia]AZQ53580.1 hypothetical protein D5R55_21895 [Burkholderia cenocepacia]
MLLPATAATQWRRARRIARHPGVEQRRAAVHIIGFPRMPTIGSLPVSIPTAYNSPLETR